MKKLNLNIQMFASGTFNVSTGNANISGYVQMKSTSNGSSENSSEVTATLYLRRTNNYTGSASSTASFSVTFTINGEKKTVTASSRVTIPNDKSYVNLGSATVTVPHNDDGSKTCTISVYTTSTSDSFTVPTTSGSLTLDKIARYFSSNPVLTANSKTETTYTFNWTTSETCSKVVVYVGGSAKGTWTGSATSGTVTATGLKAGTTYDDVYIVCTRKDSGLTTNSKTKSYTTYSYPYCTDAPSFTIGNNVILKFYNPLGRTCTIDILGDDGSTLLTATITGTERDSLGSTSTINKLYATIPNKTSGTYKVKVVYSSNTNTKQGGTYSVNKSANLPTFTNFNYEDTSTNCVALTGNNQIFINGKSDVKVTIPVANKMVAKNSATAKKYRITIGSVSKEVTYSSIAEVSATFSDVTSSSLVVTAIDSRGYETPVAKTATIINYSSPTFSKLGIQRQNGVGTVAELSVSGKYTNVNFGEYNNEILHVYYSVDSGNNWTEISDKFSYSNGNFTSIAGATIPGFKLGTEYDIIFRVKDGGKSDTQAWAVSDIKSSVVVLNSGQPILDLNKTKKGVGVNCIAEDEGLWTDGTKVNGVTSDLPSGDGTTLAYWHSLKTGKYYYHKARCDIKNAPEDYGFVDVTNLNNQEVNVMWYTQSGGPIYRLSCNATILNTWNLVSGNQTAKLLWSGDAISNSSWINLNDSAYKYKFLLIRPNSGLTYLTCPIIPDSEIVRGSNIWAGSNNMELYAFKGALGNNDNGTGYSLRQDSLIAFSIASGSTPAQNTDYTGITRVYGVR